MGVRSSIAEMPSARAETPRTRVDDVTRAAPSIERAKRRAIARNF
jgi:hypothetical protein